MIQSPILTGSGGKVSELQTFLVDRDQAENIAREIFKQHENVVFISLRVNAVANLFAHIYYDDSHVLHNTFESIKILRMSTS